MKKLEFLLLFIILTFIQCGPSDEGKIATIEGAFSGVSSSIIANWSQIVGMTKTGKDTLPLEIVARFIVGGQKAPCNQFQLVSSTSSNSILSGAIERALPADTAFQITVCQFVIPPDWSEGLLFDGQDRQDTLAKFPGPYSVGRKYKDKVVAIGLGDTGCRCDNYTSKSMINSNFKNVIQNVLAETSEMDFIFHVGDFRYYKENEETDAWSKWYAEFFRPAQPLLDKAPIAIIRGNHEECTGTFRNGDPRYWYGQRWFQFFEPTVSATVSPCPMYTPSLQEPWYFDIAAKSTTSGNPEYLHRIVMIDNSPDENNFAHDFDTIVTHLSSNFQKAIHLSKGVDSWWAMHKPLWNSNQYPSKYTEKALLEVLGNTTQLDSTLCNNGVCYPRAIMSGHAHMYQQVDFDQKIWPIQYVLGHGGVQTLTSGTDVTDQPTNFNAPAPYTSTGPFQGKLTNVFRQNGHLILTRDQQSLNLDSGWRVENCLLNQTCIVVSP